MDNQRGYATVYDNAGLDTDFNVELKTIRKILHARKNDGLYSSIVIGSRGAGKTSYAIQILYNVFRVLGYDINTSWQMALDRVLYRVPEIVSFLKQAAVNPDRDLCIWDDSGVFAGGVRWLTNQKEMVLIESICDTLRDSVYGIIFTVPNIRTLSRRLRSYDDNIVSINYLSDKKKRELVKNGVINIDMEHIREARVLRKKILPSGMVRIYKQYSDNFDVMIPDWVYEKYKEKRRRYTRDNLLELEHHLKKNSLEY